MIRIKQTKEPLRIKVITFINGIHIGYLSVFFLVLILLMALVLASPKVREEVWETGIIDLNKLQAAVLNVEYEDTSPRTPYTPENVDPSPTGAPAFPDTLDPNSPEALEQSKMTKPSELARWEMRWIIFAFIYIIIILLINAQALITFRQKKYSLSGFLQIIAGALNFPFGILEILAGAFTVRYDPETSQKN